MREELEEWPTGRLLSVAARLVEQRWRESLERLGLSHAGLVVLHLLDGGPLTLGELARRAHVTAQTMGRTVEHLERDGHVRTVIDPADRRRRSVERTAYGSAAFHAAHDLEARLFPELGDAGALHGILLSLIRSVGGDPEPPRDDAR